MSENLSNDHVNVTFLYFESCPNWKIANAALAQAATLESRTLMIRYQTVETSEAAEALEFRGSPTILIDGVDPFAAPDDPIGLSCRVYRSGGSVEGGPSIDQIRAALTP
jgi:hypothetical protein